MSIRSFIQFGALGLALSLPVFGEGHVKVPKHSSTAKQDVLYTCDCGASCTCNSLSTKPGKCACGKPLKWNHVVKVEGMDALLCVCGEGCSCKIDAKDPAKCSCGKALKRVSLKGSGIYYCNCGGSCSCNTLSSVPSKCSCGMDLKKTD